MQFISEEFKRVLSNNLKAGQLGKPRCVVEVDKMVFVPGKTEKIIIEDYNLETAITIERHWIEPNADGDYSGSTKLTYDNLVFPVQGLSYKNLTSDYGMRRGKMHNGVDFAPGGGSSNNYGRGMPILSVWDGTVSKVDGSKSLKGYGSYIDVTHDNGRRTRYAHLDKVNVKTGQKVTAGQQIGTMGNTGTVWSNGEPVKGSFEEKGTDRYNGRGTHLHFEIHEKDVNGSYKVVNPSDYFKGDVKAYNPAVSSGSGSNTSSEPISGVPGRVVVNESFILNNWYEKDRYKLSKDFLKYSSPEINQVGGIGSWNTIKFPNSKSLLAKEVTMDINVKMLNEGFLNLSYRSNFDFSEGDRFYITMNDSTNASVVLTNFEGIDKVQEINRIFVPKGDVKITIHIKWGGKVKKLGATAMVGTVPKQISLGKLHVQELSKTTEPIKEQHGGPGYSGKQEDFFNYQSGYWEEREVEDFVFSRSPQTFDLTVGDFIYSDTMELDNVMSVDIATSLEQDTTEATITLSNIDGFFSPTYNVYNFNELKLVSPFSSQMAGFQVGVLGNNTPIRIYMGYGNNLIRVFTGLIDKVDMNNSPPTITVTARDMYSKISDKVLTVTKRYPDVNYMENVKEDGTIDEGVGELEKVAWLKSAVIQDLIEHAGMFGWRAHAEDFQYPDAIIEESYLISVDQEQGTYVRAVPGKEGEFEVAELDSIPTFSGWLNPYTDEYGRTFEQYQYRVGECISEVLRDTHYRSYCDRYGTYRLETPNYKKPITASYIYGVNLVHVDSTLDFSRGRSHIIVKDESGKMESFMDKEMLMELKGEIRTASIEVGWAKTYELKKVVASRLFQDMKRVCRTVQVASECNPAIDLLDRIRVIDRDTSTNAVYTIKGIRFSYTPEGGLLQFLELFWSEDGQVF